MAHRCLRPPVEAVAELALELLISFSSAGSGALGTRSDAGA